MITFDHDTGRAQRAVKAAERRGLPVPQQIHDTAAMVAVVLDAAHMKGPARPGIDDVPDTPEELRALIEQAAHQQRIAAAHHQVANDYLEPLSRKFNALVRAQVKPWILGLQPEFNGLIKGAKAVAKVLPADLDRNRVDWNDSAVTTPWTRAEGIAFQLDQIVNDRKALAQAGELRGEGGKDNELYAVAQLPKPTREAVVNHVMRDGIAPDIHRWRELKHEPVLRWIHLVRSPHLTIGLATPDEVRTRAAARDHWRDLIEVRGVAPEPTQARLDAIDRAIVMG
ncbi:hypothetical protein AB0N99_21220 [Streptomyces sp. NPDC093272]|uniref:hypothetical protein n=1 Tax=Streptomyces sp. NPDC093272 TaxID=3154981 RepID=UPI00344AC561